MIGLESFMTLALLLGGAGIAASAGGSVLHALVNYMLVNKGCITAKEIAEILAGRKPVPGGVATPAPDDEEKRARVQQVLESEYGLYPIDISVIGSTGVVAYVSADAQRKVSANDLRYLAAKIGLPVAVAYVRVCTDCGAMTPLLELQACPKCGKPFSTRRGSIPGHMSPITMCPPATPQPPANSQRLIPNVSYNLRNLLKPTEYLIVDGSNLATRNGGVTASMWTLKKVMEQMEGHPAGYKIFVGSRFWRIVDDKEAFKQLEKEGKVIVGGQRIDDDWLILDEANEKNAIVLTNDVYAKKVALDPNHQDYNNEKMQHSRDIVDKYRWTLDKTRFIGHAVMDPEEQRIKFFRHLPAQASDEQPSPPQVRAPTITTDEPFREPEQEGGLWPPMVSPTPPEPPVLRVVCPSCQERIRPGQYCNKCGAPLVEGTPIPIDDTCSNCGGIVDRWTLRCADCGAQYEAWICDKCGSPIDAQSQRCSTCGTRHAWR